jgi:hypothetical protein
MPALHIIVYVSTASRPFSADDLVELLATSRAQNATVGITGMLLYKSGCFLQAFEGPPGVVHKLHRRIERDARHHNLVVLMDEAIDTREFSDWTMGFKNLEDEDVQHQPGFGEMMKMFQHHGRSSMDISFAIKLLRSFTTQPG